MVTPLPPELVWIDGPSEPAFVFVRPDDDAHYFYWPYEISSHGIDANDIEPIKMRAGRFLLSRYHFRGLTVWVNPPQFSNGGASKPAIRPIRNWHTPVVISAEGCVISIVSRKKFPKTRTAEKVSYLLWRRLFCMLIARKYHQPGTLGSYANKFVFDYGSAIERGKLFDARYVKNRILECIVIGSRADVNQTIQQMKLGFKGHGITGARMVEFFEI